MLLLQTVGLYYEDVTLFTMHDLVHEVARSIMVDEVLYSRKEGDIRGSSAMLCSQIVASH